SWISLYVFSSILYLYIFVLHLSFFFFFFTVTPTPEIYTLSLHDALPIFCAANCAGCAMRWRPSRRRCRPPSGAHCRRGPDRKSRDRKSTRLNSSHSQISYADFRLKKKAQYKKIASVTDIARRHFLHTGYSAFDLQHTAIHESIRRRLRSGTADRNGIGDKHCELHT